MCPMILEEVTALGPLVRTFGLVVCRWPGAPGSIPGLAKECCTSTFQISKLRRELEEAQGKVLTLTSQLNTNVSVFFLLHGFWK